MAEAEIESLLDKKYAEIENDFAALLGSAILQPQQVEAIKVTFDLTSEKEIARVLEQRGGANPDAVAAARKRTNTKLTGFLAMYDQPAAATSKPTLSDGQLNDLLKDFENGQLAETRKRADTRSADYKAKRTSVQLSPQKAPAAASVVSIPANKAAAPGGFTPTALNSSTDGGRDRSTSTLISPRKRMNSDVPDSAKRLSLFEAQLMEETERARAMMAEQQAKERDAKAREAAAAAPRDDPPSPRPGPFVRHDPPRSDSSTRRNFAPAPAATNNRGSIGGYRPPSISGNATAVRSSSPSRNSGNTTLPPMKAAPAPGMVDEPLLIDSYHRLPDDVPKEKDRNCTNCTLV